MQNLLDWFRHLTMSSPISNQIKMQQAQQSVNELATLNTWMHLSQNATSRFTKPIQCTAFH